MCVDFAQHTWADLYKYTLVYLNEKTFIDFIQICQDTDVSRRKEYHRFSSEKIFTDFHSDIPDFQIYQDTPASLCVLTCIFHYTHMDASV